LLVALWGVAQAEQSYLINGTRSRVAANASIALSLRRAQRIRGSQHERPKVKRPYVLFPHGLAYFTRM
jgi:hypothetical protein